MFQTLRGNFFQTVTGHTVQEKLCQRCHDTGRRRFDKDLLKSCSVANKQAHITFLFLRISLLGIRCHRMERRGKRRGVRVVPIHLHTIDDCFVVYTDC